MYALLVVACSTMITAQTPTEMSKPHPLAPSLRLLSQKEYDEFDRIIDRFIDYDVGKLTGVEGKQALADFNKLGPDATFSLIEGLNRAANMPASCPAVIIGKKISQLLASSTDVQLLDYARENIGAGVTVRRHMGTIKDLKLGATLRRTAIARLGITQPNNQALVLRQLPQAPAEEVRRQLNNPDIKIRMTAAQVAGQRRLPLGAELITMLDDKNAQVQTAAHQALVLLSGRDFGPSETASESERALAVQDWRSWWERQKR